MGDGSIPMAVLDACCEEALELLAHGSSKRLVLQNQHVTSMSIAGDLSESYESQPDIPTLTSKAARDLMAPYIARGGVPMV